MRRRRRAPRRCGEPALSCWGAARPGTAREREPSHSAVCDPVGAVELRLKQHAMKSCSSFLSSPLFLHPPFDSHPPRPAPPHARRSHQPTVNRTMHPIFALVDARQTLPSPCSHSTRSDEGQAVQATDRVEDGEELGTSAPAQSHAPPSDKDFLALAESTQAYVSRSPTPYPCTTYLDCLALDRWLTARAQLSA